jgi:hypothetical protein
VDFLGELEGGGMVGDVMLVEVVMVSELGDDEVGEGRGESTSSMLVDDGGGE